MTRKELLILRDWLLSTHKWALPQEIKGSGAESYSPMLLMEFEAGI
jgi:hypothetical protein